MIGLGEARNGLPEAGVLTGGLVVRVVTLGQADQAPTDLAAEGHDKGRGERILHTRNKARRGRFGFLGRACVWVAGGIGRGIGEGVGMGFGIGSEARRMGGSSKRAQALREMGRQLVISLMSMLALTITFSESATGQSYISLINRNSRLFDQDAIDESLMYFKFSAEGKLIDGPRRDAGEEIDISSIVSHDEVTRVFTQSIFDCIEGVRYCDRNKIKLPIDPISFRITNIDGQEFPEYSKKLSERILLAANFLGLDVQSEGQDGSEIEFIVVDPSSAIEAAKRTEDPYAVAYFEWEKQKADEGKGPKVALGLCYTSTKDRAIGKIFILLTPSGVDDCSMRSFLIALGLNETGGYFPSATGVDGSYKFPTLVDRAFVSILYSSDFPVDQGVDVVESYARKYLYDNPSLLKEND